MVVPVGDLAGGTSDATGINNENDVVGTHSAGSPAVIRGFLYRNGISTDIGTLAAAPCRWPRRWRVLPMWTKVWPPAIVLNATQYDSRNRGNSANG